MTSYPSIELDPVQRMRALAAALPHAVYEETVFDAPLDRVWALVGDLEAGTPQFERGVRAVEILRREGEDIELESTSRLGMKMRFDAVLRPSWCVMRSRFAQIGMAVREEPDGRTRFAHFEQPRVAGWLFRPFVKANIAHDFRRIREILREGPS